MQSQAVPVDQGETLRQRAQEPADRITRLRERYQQDVPKISIERAQYYTEKWRETEGQGLSAAVRVALAMKHVYENMTHYVNPEDRIAGYWTESFLGIPIDVERGVFNKVLLSELKKSSMALFRARSFKNMMAYMVRKGQVFDFLRNMKVSRASGEPPLNLGLDTMTERKINRFAIDPEDEKALKKEILPYWEGRNLVDLLDKEVSQSGILNRDMQDFACALPANTSRQTLMLSSCATIATIQGHVLVDHEKVVKKGLLAMREEVRREREDRDGLTHEEQDFLHATDIALEGMIVFATRLADKIRDSLSREADPQKKASLERMLENCTAVPLHPAETFCQAVQSAWILKTALELAHPVNLHCFGRLDQILYPYYARDVETGRTTRSEAREVLEELLLKNMSQNIRPESNILSNFYHRYLGSMPVTVGGVTPDGSDATNELTYLFLEASRNSKAVTNLSLRVHNRTPEELLLAVAECLHDGSNLSLFNDDVNVEAMKRRGFKEADARDYAVTGCVELTCPAKTGGLSVNALLLSRVLDITLRNGNSQTLMGRIKNMGIRTGDPDSFRTFDELVDAFINQANFQVKMIVAASNLRDKLFERELPAPLISPFIEGCLEARKDVTQGSALYDISGISYINSIANVVDSLYAIKKLVFEEKEFSVKELVEAVDTNFREHPEIHRKIKALEGMWGNGCEEVDELARQVTTRLFEESYKHESARGGVFVPFVISMITHTIDGRVSIATPDGRKAATPYAASCNPYNVEKGGVTAAMRSVASIDFRDVLGCAVNMKFHPSAIGLSEESRKKWIALLRTYFELGGSQLQPTVASAETLRAAQKNPDGYSDLMVKVGGYSAYFTELGREIQDEVIARTEHLL